MEAHARSALSTNTKQAWDQLLALIVHQTLPLQLVASQTPLVNVMPGSQEKMEPRARSAPPALLNPEWGLLVYYVLLIQSQLLAASQTLHVNVTLGTREQMEDNACSVVAARIK